MRHVVVTGATGGLGTAVCIALAQSAFVPVICYRPHSVDSAALLASRTLGLKIPLELADDASIDRASELVAAIGNVQAIVHAASPPPIPASFGRIDTTDLTRFLRVNVVGPQRLIAAVVKSQFRAAKRGAVIAVQSRAMGHGGEPAAAGFGAYTISKFGFEGVLALLRVEFPWLRVRSIYPTFMDTPMLRTFDSRFVESLRARHAIQQPLEVAHEIVAAIEGSTR